MIPELQGLVAIYWTFFNMWMITGDGLGDDSGKIQ